MSVCAQARDAVRIGGPFGRHRKRAVGGDEAEEQPVATVEFCRAWRRGPVPALPLHEAVPAGPTAVIQRGAGGRSHVGNVGETGRLQNGYCFSQNREVKLAL